MADQLDQTDAGEATQRAPGFPAPPGFTSSPKVAPPNLDSLQSKIRSLFATGAPSGGVDPDTPEEHRYPAGSPQDLTVKAAQRYGQSPAMLLALAESESGFNPGAISKTGATGLFQFTRGTAKRYGVDRTDPASSADGAARYMRDILQRNGGDLSAAIAEYKGVSAGGATMGNVADTISRMSKYGGGYTADATGAGAQNAGTQPPAPYPLPSTPAPSNDRSATDTQTPFGTPPDTQTTIAEQLANQNPPQPDRTGTGAVADTYIAQIDADRKRASQQAQTPPPAPKPIEGIKRLYDLVNQIGLRTSHTTPAIPQAQPNFTEPKGPYADRGPLEPAGAWMERVDKRLSDSPTLAALQQTLQSLPGSAAVSMRAVGEAVNAALGDVPQALLPRTFETFEDATTSGSPAVDWLVNTGSQGLGFVGSMIAGGEMLDAAGVPLQGAARTAALMSARAAPADAIQVAMGRKDPISALLDVAVVQPAVGALFHGASVVGSTPGRVAASAAVSGAGYVAGQAVAGQPVTLAGAAEAAGVGGIYGIAGGHTPEGVKATEVKATVDTKAHEAATSPMNDRPEPTPAQQEAGNYKKGHVSIHGLDISIENPQGSTRSGMDADGKPWEVTMQDHYGYIKGTKGSDGDHVDTFIGPDPASEKVYVVDQIAKPAAVSADGETVTPSVHDEHKVVLGANSRLEATEIYKRNYADDATPRIGAVTETTMPEFKRWLSEGDTKLPFNENLKDGYSTESTGEKTTPAPQRDAGRSSASRGPREDSAISDGDRPDVAERTATTLGGDSTSGAATTEVGVDGDRPSSYTREQFQQDLTDKFNLPDDQRTATMALADAHSEQWAKQNNTKPEDWYSERLAGVTNEAAPDGSLVQLGGNSRAGLKMDLQEAIAAEKQRLKTYRPDLQLQGLSAGDIVERMRDEHPTEMFLPLDNLIATKDYVLKKTKLEKQIRAGADAMTSRYGKDRDNAIRVGRDAQVSLGELTANVPVAVRAQLHDRAPDMLYQGYSGYSKSNNAIAAAVDREAVRLDRKEKPPTYAGGRVIEQSENKSQSNITNDIRGNQPESLFQSSKGAVSFREDGKAVIHAFQSGDVSTVAHELAHVWRRDLPEADLKVAGEWAGAKDGKWDVAAEEKFARGFERYLRDGNAPTAKLRDVFGKFKAWLTNIYKSLKGSPIEGNISPEIKGVFDRMLAEERSGGRPPIPLHDTGRETTLRTGDVKVPVKYALVESRDVELSHDPQTFAENPRYAGENQNRYDTDPVQQAAVSEGGQDLDFDILHSTTTTSTEGPTVIDPFGMAAGGNGRGMMMKRAYESKPELTKLAVVADAAKFGLDPHKAAEMERPTIVRVQEASVDRSVESRRNISAQNQTATKQRTPAVEGVDLSKRLTPENKSLLSEGLAEVKSLAELTESAEKAKPVIKVLRDAGQITKANQNEYITPEATLTPKGRETVEGMTMGLIVPDATLIGKLPDGFRQKLGENLRTLGAVESTPGWELHENLARVTDYVEARRAFIERGGVKAMYDAQENLLPDAKDRPPMLTNEDRLLLKLLEEPKRTKFKDFMQSYANAASDARAGETDLSGESMTRERAFREAEAAAGLPPRPGLGGYFDATKEADNEYIKNSLGKLGANLDPELAFRVARRGAALIYDGVKDLAEYTRRMIDEFGERVRDDIAGLYVQSRAIVLVNAGEGMRGTVKDLAEAYARKPEVSDFKRIAGTFTGAVQMLDHELVDYARTLKDAVPDVQRREAIGNYIQAGGDENLLLDRAANSAPKYQRGYEAAARLTPEEKAFAEAARARQEQNGRDAQEAGLIENLVDNYLHGEYIKDPQARQQLSAMAASGYFETNPSALRSKIYDTYFDAEQAGLTPKTKDFAQLVVHNERALKVAALAREAVHAMLDSKEKDGLPTVVVGGAGHLVEAEPGSKEEKTAPFLVTPNAGFGTDMSKYKYFDHPALRKWKWIGTDSGKRPVLMQGDMWVHRDAYAKMTGLLGRSKIRDWGPTIPNWVPGAGGKKPAQAALDAGAFIKGTIMLGPFHQFNVDQHAAYHGVSPFRMPAIDFQQRPLLAEGVTHGLMLVTHGPESEFNDVMAAGALHHLPVVGDALKRYQTYLFQEHIPKLKALTFEVAFTRAEKRYAGEIASGTLSRDQLLDIVANQSNAMYGELNYRYPGGSFLHDPTVRDVARLALLAPDFLEARMRSFGQAFRPHGHEQRMALLRGALVMGATAQITNILIGDDHKAHWDRPFSVIIGGREYSSRSEVADIAHLVADPRGFWYHRLNPLWGRPLVELLEGRDMAGNKVGLGEAGVDILKSWTPIPAQGLFKNNLGSTAAQSVADGMLGSVGISNFQYRTDGEKFIAERARAKWSPEKPSGDAMELFAGKSELRDAYRKNASSAEIEAIKTKYAITNKQAARARHDAAMPPLALKAERLTVQELADAFDHHLNAEERQHLAPLFARKLNAANDKYEMPEEEKSFYRTKYGLSAVRSSAPSSSGVAVGIPY